MSQGLEGSTAVLHTHPWDRREKNYAPKECSRKVSQEFLKMRPMHSAFMVPFLLELCGTTRWVPLFPALRVPLQGHGRLASQQCLQSPACPSGTRQELTGVVPSRLRVIQAVFAS